MPNWCSNSLVVTGPENVLKNFIAKGESEEGQSFSMNPFVPMPVGIESGWYDWACENWGTKWDINEARVAANYKDGEVEIDFDTAWGPPLKFVEKASGLFPELIFRLMYAEPGMCFGGTHLFEAGERVFAVETQSNQSTALLSRWHASQMGEDIEAEEEQDIEDENDSDEGGE